MKIINIIPSLSGGGAEKFCIDLCNALSNDDEVILCSLFDVTDQMFLVKHLNSKVKLVSLHKKPGLDISLFYRVFSFLRKERPNIVNTHLRALFYSVLAVLSMRFRIYHTTHTLAYNECNKWMQKMYYIFFNFFRVKPIAISKAVQESIHLRYGSKHNILIENGTAERSVSDAFKTVKEEVDSLKPDKETAVFLTIGRLAPEKNYGMLINAVNRLINNGHNVMLMIVGEDPVIGEPVKKQLIPYSSDRIFFMGTRSNVPDYLSCCDAFCLSSKYEGLPITLLEAMSLGVIAVCTPAGGVVNVITPATGIISSEISQDSYVEALTKFMSLSADQKTHMRAASLKEFQDKYDIAINARRYKNLYMGSK